jgi:hypothetical protein
MDPKLPAALVALLAAVSPGIDPPPITIELTAGGGLTLDGASTDLLALPDALRGLGGRELLLRVAGSLSCAVLEPLLDACAAGSTALAENTVPIELAIGDGAEERRYQLFLRAADGAPDPLPQLRIGAVDRPQTSGRLYRELKDAADRSTTLHLRADASASIATLGASLDLARRAAFERFELTVALPPTARRAAAAGDLERLIAQVPRPDDRGSGRHFDGPQPPAPGSDRIARAIAAGRPVGGVFARRVGGRLQLARDDSTAAALAIGRGLDWLCAQQGADGSWAEGDAFATAAALMAFLADGSTAHRGEYQDVVERAAGWLGGALTERGNFDVGGLHAQAVATTALIEAAGLSRSAELLERGQRALDLLLAMRDRDGVWRDGGELEAHIGAHCVLAWRVARELGLKTADDAARPTVTWLAELARSADPPPGAAAAALWAAQLAGDAAAARELAAELLPRIATPPGDGDLLRSLHDAAAALHQQGGTTWTAWRDALVARLASGQHSDGDLAGSWNADGGAASPADRVEATADACLTLAVQHRFAGLAR